MPSSTRLCHGLSSLVVIQISLRGTPESMMPCPTSASLPYARALFQTSQKREREEKGRPSSRVNVTVSSEKSVSDSQTNFIRLGLPGSQAHTGDLIASVQSEHGP